MNDDRRRPDPLVIAALRRLGDEHEPDTEAIWARVDPTRGAADVPVALDGRRDRAVRARPATVQPWRSRFSGVLAASLAAASVLGVFVVTQSVTRSSESSSPATGPAVASVDSTSSLPPVPTKNPDDLAPTVLGTPVSTNPAAPPRKPSGGPTSTPLAPSSPSLASTVPPVAGFPAPVLAPLGPDGRALSLSTDRLLNWVVSGARDDGKQVRAKSPGDVSMLQVAPPAGADVTPSELSVSWSGGFSEQSRNGAATWLRGPRGAAWTLTVERADLPRWLVVYAGEAPEGLQVDISSPQGRTGRWVRGGNPAGFGPFTVAFEVPAGVGPLTITLTPSNRDGLALSAVTLERK